MSVVSPDHVPHGAMFDINNKRDVFLGKCVLQYWYFFSLLSTPSLSLGDQSITLSKVFLDETELNA
jgi:hypothetical protein